MGNRSKAEFLVSAVKEDVLTLPERMNLSSDAIIVNQCGENSYQEYEYRGHRMRCFSFAEKGVGLSRNNCLLRANHEISVFADEDIVYDDGAAELIEKAFEEHPRADMLLFNVQAAPGRETYHIDSYGRVRWYNCGRYPTYSIAARTKALRKAGVSFSLLFGGGAPYSNGEDSLFLMDSLRAGLKIYHSPVSIGHENGRPSTWFQGYTNKFFYDRGVLYAPLYGAFAELMGLRFLWKNRKEFFEDNKELDLKKGLALLKSGIRDFREGKLS